MVIVPHTKFHEVGPHDFLDHRKRCLIMDGQTDERKN